MWSAIKHCWSIIELRNRIIFTIGIIAVARMTSNIPCPGINTEALSTYMANLVQTEVGGMISMISMFSGGAIENFSLACLGIMPYITSSIVMQLMTPVLPALEKLQREGESGRQKIQQYTRYLTLLIAVVQGLFAAMAILNPAKLGLPAVAEGSSLVLNLFNPSEALTTSSQFCFIVLTVIVLSAGAMVMVWLSDRITERGIGNGASIIITIGILSRFPSACYELFERFMSGGTATAKFGVADIFMLVLLFGLVTAFGVILTQGCRHVPIQMARKMMGTGRAAMGTTTHLPLKVNYAGIMPIIFAGALLQLPPMLVGVLANSFPDSQWLIWLHASLQYGSMGWSLLYAAMIIIFSYFWVANQFNPLKISDSLKRDGAYIPGIRPGADTAKYLDYTMTRLTFAGALMLTALAILPTALNGMFGIPFNIAQFFGGTSLLIAVGVTLDTLNQVESHLVTKNYDGFIKSGRIRGRAGL